MFSVGDQWLAVVREAQAKATKPATPTEAELRLGALEGLQRASESHARAVADAVKGEGPDVPQWRVSAVLTAGTALDHALAAALKHHTVAEILAAVPELHPLYVEELQRLGPPSPF